jgi:hypothetical protein
LEDVLVKIWVGGDIKFQGIEKFNRTKTYLFYAGNLKWVKEDWDTTVTI